MKTGSGWVRPLRISLRRSSLLLKAIHDGSSSAMDATFVSGKLLDDDDPRVDELAFEFPVGLVAVFVSA